MDGFTRRRFATNVRNHVQVFATQWQNLNSSEQALLKNLGWSQNTWNTKASPTAKWPAAMTTPFVSLNPVQRESVRKLGFLPHDWDQRVQTYTSGKNA